MLTAFNEEAVARAIKNLHWSCGLAFGAACASRIAPVFERFRAEIGWGDVGLVRQALDNIWRCADRGILPPEAEIREQILKCEMQAPDSESFESLFTSGAQDCVFAVCSLLDFCVDMDVGRVVLAARYPTDSIDLYVQEIEHMNISGPELEAAILKHPLMQQELRRQKRDMAALSQLGREAIPALIQRRETEDALQLE